MKDIIFKMLKDNNLKITPQRISVLESVISSKKHPSADKIVEDVRKKNPNIAVGTVYNILDGFVEKGILKRISTSEGKMRYDAYINEHHHIYLNNTNEIIDYYDNELDKILKDYFQNKQIENININDVRVEIHGEIKKINNQ
jgi:Fur family peroxide stress response transcriptional regulator